MSATYKCDGCGGRVASIIDFGSHLKIDAPDCQTWLDKHEDFCRKCTVLVKMAVEKALIEARMGIKSNDQK